jgi:hypothetical protein
LGSTSPFGQLSDGFGTDLGSESRPAGTDVVVDLDAERLREPPESIRSQKVEIHPKLWKVFE